MTPRLAAPRAQWCLQSIDHYSSVSQLSRGGDHYLSSRGGAGEKVGAICLRRGRTRNRNPGTADSTTWTAFHSSLPLGCPKLILSGSSTHFVIRPFRGWKEGAGSQARADRAWRREATQRAGRKTERGLWVWPLESHRWSGLGCLGEGHRSQ